MCVCVCVCVHACVRACVFCCFVGLCTHLKLYLSVILCFKGFVTVRGLRRFHAIHICLVSVDCTVVSRKQEYVICVLLFLSVFTFVPLAWPVTDGLEWRHLAVAHCPTPLIVNMSPACIHVYVYTLSAQSMGVAVSLRHCWGIPLGKEGSICYWELCRQVTIYDQPPIINCEILYPSAFSLLVFGSACERFASECTVFKANLL